MSDDLDIIEPDVAAAANYIMKSWQSGVGSIIETGRRLIEVRERFRPEPGKWSRLIGDNQWQGKSLLPFQKTHVKRLVAIAENDEIRLRPHVGVLPSDTYTLYQLTRLSDQRFGALLAAGVINPAMKRNEASAETRRESKQADEHRVRELIPLPGKYRALVVDPPWDYEWLSLAGRASPGYATMTHEQLLDLDVGAWAEDNCHLYLWTTNNFVTRASELMARWGFQHKTMLTWVKPRWGLGSYFRNQTEHVLFGVRGTLRTRSDSISTVFYGEMGQHSEKPEEFYEIVRAASYEPFGEVFQRKVRADFPNLYGERQEEPAHDPETGEILEAAPPPSTFDISDIPVVLRRTA